MPESSFFEWLTLTDFALYLRKSPYLIGLLSAIHLLGLTLIGGSGIVSCLRSVGILLPERPLVEILKPAGQGIFLGFGLSLGSGVFLFAPRAASAVQNPAFQIKMTLALAAVVFHCTLYYLLARRVALRPPVLSLAAVLGLALWLGVAFAGFAFAVFN
jgi:hypothetical protein